MKLVIVLRFNGGVHFGADFGGFGVESVQGFLHSDSIFSAILNTLSLVHHKLPKHIWIDNLLCKSTEPTQIPFVPSSFCFLDKTKAGPEFYIHRPLIFPDKLIDANSKIRFGKNLKRLQFISLKTFLKWQNNEKLNAEQMITETPDMFWIPEIRTQHLTDNCSLATQIYRTGMVYYPSNILPFFIVDLDTDSWPLQEFISVIKTLQYQGLGGRRSGGSGSFTFTNRDWFVIDVKDVDEQKRINPDYEIQYEQSRIELLKLLNYQGSNMMTLSTFYPLQFNKDNAISYQLLQRRGWLFSPGNLQNFKRKTCFMFGEGSIFKKKLEGRLVNVTPSAFNDHNVYRCGLPFYVPMSEVTV